MVAVDGGGSGRDVVLDGDNGGGFRERHRFIRWMEVLGRQGWGRGRIFLASPRVWDDRELEGKMAGFCGWRFRIEYFLSLGGVGWLGGCGEKEYRQSGGDEGEI